jgi:hypothetical protein
MVYNESTFGFIMNNFLSLAVAALKALLLISKIPNHTRIDPQLSLSLPVFIFLSIHLIHEIYFEYHRYLITFTP